MKWASSYSQPKKPGMNRINESGYIMIASVDRKIIYLLIVLFKSSFHGTIQSKLRNVMICDHLTLSGAGGCSEARMTKFRAAIQNAKTLCLLVFIFKTCSDQICYQGVAAALFSSRHPKNFENENIFLCLKFAEIDMEGSILCRKERIWTEKLIFQS